MMATHVHMSGDTGDKEPPRQRFHRVTRSGRKLWYELVVLQQPERARACGAGVKANSDRRPVDPPPVVQLNIREGETFETGKMITFTYNANFFCYASLEHSRTLAHGRVQTPAANCPPILTGTPAAGMAYLDRPDEAGYFLFPDLSVRHEGYYRLVFSLFETTKEEGDFDQEPADGDLPPGVDWRMEIKTNSFNVYSAKKFPGLMESTELSRTVAEQGCRVRIRRDVRMRKRDKNTNYDGRGEDYSRRRTVTPANTDDPQLRPRSVSNSSNHRVPYNPQDQRRPSLTDAHAAALPPPPGFSPAPASRGHLAFVDNRPHYAAPPRQYSHQAPLQAAPISPTGPYTPSAQSPRMKLEHQAYGYASAHPASQPSSSPAQPIKADPYDRHYSGPYAQSPTTYAPTENYGRRDSYSSHSADSVRLPPISSRPPPKTAPLMSVSDSMPKSGSSMSIDDMLSPTPQAPRQAPSRGMGPLESAMAPIEADTEPRRQPVHIPTGSKRGFNDTFQEDHRRVANHKRQVDPHYNEANMHGNWHSDPDVPVVQRADGSYETIQFPSYSH